MSAKKVWRPFEEAREFARSLKLRGVEEWYQYAKTDEKPDDIPSSPDIIYKNDGWIGSRDWLGNEYLPFKESRDFIRSLNLRSQIEWQQYCKSNKKPDDIPSSPDIIYKNDGWISLGDWLGTGSIATKNRVYLSFKESREFARSLKLNGSREWFQYAKTDKKPDDIPGNPRDAYLNDGWISWGDWVGTEWRPFEEAREFARSLKLRGVEEWYQYAKTDEKPNDIPAAPSYVYKNDGWKDWIDWLGNEDRIVSEETKRKLSEAAKGRKKPL